MLSSTNIPHNRGTGYATAVVTITGNGYAEELQIGNTMVIDGIDTVPDPGANVVFAGDTTVYRLVKVTKTEGTKPTEQLRSNIVLLQEAQHPCTWNYSNYKRKISQARLDRTFLDIGTGNFENTNYPGLYVFGQTSANATKQANEVREANGGRVFYTSTDPRW